MWLKTAAVVGAMVVGTMSSKTAMQVGQVSVLQGAAVGDAADWSTLFSTTLHTSQQGELQIAVSLEAGFFDATLVRSKGGTSDTSVARIEVQVLVDGVVAEAGAVIHGGRSELRMASFGGGLPECADSDANGAIFADECTFTDEELGLILDSLNAHSFSFGYPNAESGDHTIEVRARIRTDAN